MVEILKDLALEFFSSWRNIARLVAFIVTVAAAFIASSMMGWTWTAGFALLGPSVMTLLFGMTWYTRSGFGWTFFCLPGIGSAVVPDADEFRRQVSIGEALNIFALSAVMMFAVVGLSYWDYRVVGDPNAPLYRLTMVLATLWAMMPIPRVTPGGRFMEALFGPVTGAKRVFITALGICGVIAFGILHITHGSIMPLFFTFIRWGDPRASYTSVALRDLPGGKKKADVLLAIYCLAMGVVMGANLVLLARM